MQPGEISRPYIFKSESRYEFTTITLQAENVSDSPCSLPEAAIVKAVIDDAKEIYVDPVRIDLALMNGGNGKIPMKCWGFLRRKQRRKMQKACHIKTLKFYLQ